MERQQRPAWEAGPKGKSQRPKELALAFWPLLGETWPRSIDLSEKLSNDLFKTSSSARLSASLILTLLRTAFLS